MDILIYHLRIYLFSGTSKKTSSEFDSALKSMIALISKGIFRHFYLWLLLKQRLSLKCSFWFLILVTLWGATMVATKVWVLRSPYYQQDLNLFKSLIDWVSKLNERLSFISRTTWPDVFLNTSVLKIFTKFTIEHAVVELILSSGLCLLPHQICTQYIRSAHVIFKNTIETNTLKYTFGWVVLYNFLELKEDLKTYMDLLEAALEFILHFLWKAWALENVLSAAWVLVLEFCTWMSYFSTFADNII